MFDMNGPPGFGSMMSTLFPSLFFLVFFLMIGVVLFIIFQNVRQWNHNNKQPVLTVDAVVVTKRTQVSRRSNRHGNGHMHTNSSTYYYVTFEVESGDRMELSVNGNDFGMLAERDFGRLRFQGTRYLGFERISQ